MEYLQRDEFFHEWNNILEKYSTEQYMWRQGYGKLIKTIVMLKDMKTFFYSHCTKYLHVYGTPTKRQVSKRQVSKRPVSKRLVSKRQVYKTSVLQNVRFQNVWFQNVQFLNLIYLLNKKYGNCQVCIPI
jgi:hypothetical protein